MLSPSNVSLLLRPDHVAGQMAKDARLKRLQQVREAEKAASKAQRARYNERKGNIKRNERNVEKTKWEQEHQNRVDKSAEQLASRMKTFGGAHKSASNHYQELKMKAIERENLAVEQIAESKHRAVEADRAFKEEALRQQKEICRARQQLITETRSAAQVSGREKAHRKSETRKALEGSKQAAIPRSHAMPITTSAETHPLGTRTGGTKLVDFSRTRMHATVTKYPPVGLLDSENEVPTNCYPTPHNMAKQVMAHEPIRRQAQEESERRRNNAIQMRSEKAEESVHLQRVSAKVELAFKKMAERERQHRIQEARDGIVHHRSAVATIADLSKQKKKEEYRREHVVESWFKEHPVSDSYLDQVSIVPNKVDDMHPQEFIRENVRRHRVSVDNDSEPQVLPLWLAPNHMPAKPTLPRWNSPTKPLAPPAPPSVSVPPLQWAVPDMEDEKEVRGTPYNQPNIRQKAKSKPKAIEDRGEMSSEASTMDFGRKCDSMTQSISTTFTVRDNTVLDMTSISNNNITQRDDIVEESQEEYQHDESVNETVFKVVSEAVEEEELVTETNEAVFDDAVSETVLEEEEDEEAVVDDPVSLSESLVEDEVASVSASILQPFNLSALEVEINRSKAYLEASKVLAAVIQDEKVREPVKSVVFEYANSSDGSDSTDSSFSRHSYGNGGAVERTVEGPNNSHLVGADLTPSPAASFYTGSSSDLPNPLSVLESFRRSRQDQDYSNDVELSASRSSVVINKPSLELSIDPLGMDNKDLMVGIDVATWDVASESSVGSHELSTHSFSSLGTPQAVHANRGDKSSLQSSPRQELDPPSVISEVREGDISENVVYSRASQHSALTSDVNSEAMKVDDNVDDDSDSLSFGYLSTDEGPVFPHNLITLPLNQGGEFGVELESTSSFMDLGREVSDELSGVNESELRDEFENQSSQHSFNNPSIATLQIQMLNGVPSQSSLPNRGVSGGGTVSSDHASSLFSAFSGLEGMSMASSLTMKSMEDMEKVDMESSYDVAESLATQESCSQASPKREHSKLGSLTLDESYSSSGSWSSDENSKSKTDLSANKTDNDGLSSASLSTSLSATSFDPGLSLLQQQQQTLRAQMERNRALMTAFDDMSSDYESSNSYEKSKTQDSSVSVTHSSNDSDLEGSQLVGKGSVEVDATRESMLGEAISMMAELNMDPIDSESEEEGLILDQGEESEDMELVEGQVDDDGDNVVKKGIDEEKSSEVEDEKNEDGEVGIDENVNYSRDLEDETDQERPEFAIQPVATTDSAISEDMSCQVSNESLSSSLALPVGSLVMEDEVTYSVSVPSSSIVSRLESTSEPTAHIQEEAESFKDESASLSATYLDSANIMGDTMTGVCTNNSNYEGRESSVTDAVSFPTEVDVEIAKDSTLDLSSHELLEGEEGSGDSTDSDDDVIDKEEDGSSNTSEAELLPSASELLLTEADTGGSWLKGSISLEDQSESSRLSAIHQLDTINLEDFLGDKFTNIETSMAKLGHYERTLPLHVSVEPDIGEEAPLPSSSSWSPAHPSSEIKQEEVFRVHNSPTSGDMPGDSFLSSGSLESESNNVRTSDLSPENSERSKTALVSPSMNSLKDSTVTSGLVGVSMTSRSMMSSATKMSPGSFNQSKDMASFSPSREQILSQQAPLSDSTQRTNTSNMPPSPIVYQQDEISGSTSDEARARGVMEFDMGQKRDDLAKSKANSFLERSQARAREAKEVAKTKIAPVYHVASSSITSSGTEDEEEFSTPAALTSTEVLASRLAQGKGPDKVPLKEARSRSSRLYKELPEVVAARKKETEAREKAERVAQAKADDRARRLSSAEKTKRSRRRK